MLDIKKYLIHFEEYVENPSMLLPPQEKKIFDKDILEISKRIGGGGFLGLFKRKITPEAIVSYKATELVFEVLRDSLLSKGFHPTDNAPVEVLPLSYDDYLHETFVKKDMYVTIYGKGVWLSPHYELNVLFYKDFDFDMYREQVAEKLKSNYEGLLLEDEYSNITFDFDPKNLQEPQLVLKEFEKILNNFSKLTINTLRNYW